VIDKSYIFANTQNCWQHYIQISAVREFFSNFSFFI